MHCLYSNVSSEMVHLSREQRRMVDGCVKHDIQTILKMIFIQGRFVNKRSPSFENAISECYFKFFTPFSPLIYIIFSVCAHYRVKARTLKINHSYYRNKNLTYIIRYYPTRSLIPSLSFTLPFALICTLEISMFIVWVHVRVVSRKDDISYSLTESNRG